MKIFLTGASGYIGSAIVKELITAGHKVTGLARSARAAKIISDAGAEVLQGDLSDLEILKQASINADGVIHAAFNHDFMKGGAASFLDSAATDKAAINAIGEAMAGTGKSLVVTSGMLGLPLIDGLVTEESTTENSPRTSEATTLALAEKGIHASVIRLAPSVHDKGDYGFIPFMISLARKHAISAFPNDGSNQWCAVHRLDAARAFRLAVEKGNKGALYNITGDAGIEMKTIANLIGDTLGLPVQSVSGDELTKHFEWMTHFIGMNCPAANAKTKDALGWEPAEKGLLEDMKENYF